MCYSGASLAYAIGAILGGGFAPVTANYVVMRTHTGLSVGIYMALATAIGLISTVLIRPSDMVGHGTLRASSAPLGTA